MKLQKRSNKVRVRFQNSSNSAETVASIEDLLTQILIKLPVKALIRFKLVSKHFHSLITSHAFCLMRNPIPNPAIGIILRIGARDEDRYVPLHPNSSVPPPFNLTFGTDTAYIYTSIILHSCNGLLLLRISKLSVESLLHISDYSTYVYNPTTNLSKRLPDLEWNRLGATLVFDPVKSPRYKVVMVVTKGISYRVHIYSSETRVWNAGCEGRMKGRDGVIFEKGVYWNGSVHWLTRKLSALDHGKSLRFHVETGLMDEMSSPPVLGHLHSVARSYYFGESCNHLHFVELTLPKFNVYELKRDYSEWFVKYKVDLSVFINEHPRMIKKRSDGRNYYVAYVLSLVRGENDEDSELVLRIPGKAVKVNLVDGASRKLCDIKHNNAFYEGICSETYHFIGECGFDYIQSLCGV